MTPFVKQGDTGGLCSDVDTGVGAMTAFLAFDPTIPARGLPVRAHTRGAGHGSAARAFQCRPHGFGHSASDRRRNSLFAGPRPLWSELVRGVPWARSLCVSSVK